MSTLDTEPGSRALVDHLLAARAQSLAHHGKFQEARDLLSTISPESCESKEILDLKARICAQCGEIEAALAHWRQAASLDPADPAIQAAIRRCERLQTGRTFQVPFRALVAVGFGVLVLAALYTVSREAERLAGRIEQLGRQLASIETRIQAPVPLPAVAERPSPRPAVNINQSLAQLGVTALEQGDIVYLSGSVPTLHLRYQAELMARSAARTAAVDLRGVTITGAYRVRAGDSLWKVAEHVYGDPHAWLPIASANSLKPPYRLEAGRNLLVPTRNGG